MDSRIATRMKYSQASGSIPPDSRSSWDEIPGRLHQHSVYSSDMLHRRRIPHIPIKILAGVVLLILTTMSCRLSPKQLALTMVSETTTAQYQFDMAVASAIAKTECAKSSSSPTERPRDLDIQPFSLATPIPRISPQPEELAADVDVTILEWDMGKGIDPTTFTIRQPTSKFGTQDSIYILLHTIASGSVSSSYRSEWYDSRGMLWLVEEGSISLGESFWYLFSNPPSLTDWTPDEYIVILFVNNEQISRFTFTIEE